MLKEREKEKGGVSKDEMQKPKNQRLYFFKQRGGRRTFTQVFRSFFLSFLSILSLSLALSAP